MKSLELSSYKTSENLLNIQNGGTILAILKSLNANNFPIFQPILMKLVSKIWFIELFVKNILIIRVVVTFKKMNVIELHSNLC